MRRVMGTVITALGATLLASSAYADTKAGVDAYNAGDYNRAVAEWRPAAIAGDPDAQYNLGQAYKLGRGVTRDLDQALYWYKRAADQSPPHQKAQAMYGLLLIQRPGKSAEAMPYVQAAAANGMPLAQFALGVAYNNGDGVPRDNVKAYAYITLASQAGVDQASDALARMDQALPADVRQKGQTLAVQLDAQTKSRQVDMAVPAPTGPQGPQPLKVTALPPSSAPGVTYAPQGITPPGASPMGMEPKPPKRVPPVRPLQTPIAPSTPMTKPTALAAASGRYRVQLGAFSDQTKAQHFGEALLAKDADFEPFKFFLVNAGAVTRLQAGPLATRADADRLCASARAHGSACIIVTP